MNKLVAVSIGDIEGIGIEILIEEWKKGKISNFVLITNFKLFKKYLDYKKFSINLFKTSIVENKMQYSKKSFNIFNIETSNYNHNALISLEESYKLVKKKFCFGIVTLPINKKKINKISKNFVDQTSFFTRKDNKKISNMIFIHNNTFFVPLTIHVELKSVSSKFKKTNTIIKKIKSLSKTLKTDFGINNPKYIMAGINPHNGEDGVISSEDNKLIKPIIRKLSKYKININGPISPDSIVTKKNLKKYDCFIFTYHDQALIPFKLISNYSGVNYTSNLDVIRVSPDHGTAYDMIGNNKKSSMGILNSFKLLKKISSNRIKYAKSKEITWSKFSY